jgi:hypothetical protein
MTLRRTAETKKPDARGLREMAFNQSARKSMVAVASLDMDQRETWSADEMIVLGSARDPDARSSRVLLDSPDVNKWERAHLRKSTTGEAKNERINHR